MKKDYNKPELNITSFEANDVISLSANNIQLSTSMKKKSYSDIDFTKGVNF